MKWKYKLNGLWGLWDEKNMIGFFVSNKNGNEFQACCILEVKPRVNTVWTEVWTYLDIDITQRSKFAGQKTTTNLCAHKNAV